jgi:hypothetical protein
LELFENSDIDYLIIGNEIYKKSIVYVWT